MGTIWEKSSRKRKICRYQRPAKCCRPTMTSDTTTRAPNRILVKQLTSKSNKPTWHEQQGQKWLHVNRNGDITEVIQITRAVPFCFFIQRFYWGVKNTLNIQLTLSVFPLPVMLLTYSKIKKTQILYARSPISKVKTKFLKTVADVEPSREKMREDWWSNFLTFGTQVGTLMPKFRFLF